MCKFWFPTRIKEQVKKNDLDETTTVATEINIAAHDDTANRQEQALDHKLEKALALVRYRQTIVEARCITAGPDAVITAAAYLDLGQAYLDLAQYSGNKNNDSISADYECAEDNFGKALDIYETRTTIMSESDDIYAVAIATALTGMTVAWLHNAEKCRGSDSTTAADAVRKRQNQALAWAQRAFEIRFEALGPWHADTVGSLSQLGAVRAARGEHREAVSCHEEVYAVRRVVFGSRHPATAVAAHTMACALLPLLEKPVPSGNSKDDHDSIYASACWYMEVALDIYENGMQLPVENPSVRRLLKDMARLQHLRLEQQKTTTAKIPNV